MKVRTGFVSNSSSSSFMAVVKATEFTKLKKKLDPLCGAILDRLSCGKKKLGQSQYVVMHDYGSSEDEPDYQAIAKALNTPGAEKKIKDLPEVLKGIEDPSWRTINDAMDEANYDWYDLYEYMDMKSGLVHKALKELEKQGLAITHSLSC